MQWIHNDGGRIAAGYVGETGDCVCRAIAIATEQPYQTVYDALNATARRERPGAKRRGGTRSSARTGIFKATERRYLTSIGWVFHPTMGIGTGCTVHLKAGELPMGRLVVACSKHSVAVINGVIHDTHDPSRNGTRCVYGYYQHP